MSARFILAVFVFFSSNVSSFVDPGGAVGTAAATAEPMPIEAAAKTFGADPAVWGMRLSPDGQRVSALMRHSSGIPIATVTDLRGGKPKLILASDAKKKLNIQWCDWANDQRLLCGYYGVMRVRRELVPITRLVAVNEDGSNQQVLAQREQRGEWSFNQDEVVDWLSRDREHILMEIKKGRGEGVSSVNIYRNKVKVVERARDNAWGWVSDGHGGIRLRLESNRHKASWRYKPTEGAIWGTLHQYDVDDHTEVFGPAGFGEDPSQLFVWDKHEGRVSIFSIDLSTNPTVESRNQKLVYSHPEADLDGVARIGRHRRTIGVSYSTDKPHVDYFDEAIQRVDAALSPKLPDQIISYVSESWDRRFYLIRTSSDVGSGTYYRFDVKTKTLARIASVYPHMDDISLNPMKPIRYPSDDGVEIPSYLSMPAGLEGPFPTVILPHGGPLSRDEWGFDFLVQYLTARGYAVLQSNYRGSGGYGDEWAGEGAYRAWKRAMTDLEFGARHLIQEGIADPDRLCVLGWSYGGYAALMSAIEYPNRYRCAVSIAGVSDPASLVRDSWGIGRRQRKSQIGTDMEELRKASPRRRAEEIQVPVLLFHGDRDLNVPVEHSTKMRSALKRAKKQVDYVEYEDVEHSIRDQGYRVDMLQRIGEFLEENLAPLKPSPPSPLSSAPASEGSS